MRGDEAERRALAHLRRQGLRLVAHNWRCRAGELDLVMLDGDTLAVVEVRARSGSAHGGAAESVTAAKRGRIEAATRLFLAAHPDYARHPLRFDLVTLDGTADPAWLKGAFEAGSG